MKKKLSKSVRKFVRQEKTRIYREFLDLEKQKKAIGELYEKFIKVKKEKTEKKSEKNKN